MVSIFNLSLMVIIRIGHVSISLGVKILGKIELLEVTNFENHIVFPEMIIWKLHPLM